ncbi:MAG: hypothetical protein QOE95_784 [Gaiellaceae bacterium]|nr:hypothetical protein [Gaiellaceae bacterium]
MSIWIYFAVPLAVLPLVMLLGFVGCGLNSDGLAQPETPETPRPDPYHTVIENTPELVAYWPLGDADGTIAHDAVGPPPDGSHQGKYQTWTAPADPDFQSDAANGVLMLGQPGLIPNDQSRRSITVDGGYVEVPFADVLNAPKFSVEAIVQTNWDETAMPAYRLVFASREDVGGNIRGLTLFANLTNQWEARIGVDTATAAAAPAADPPISLGTTDFLAVTYDGTTLALYVNGEPRGSVEPGTAYVPNASRPLFIGAREDTPETPVYPFKGQVQEVAYYSRALSADEVLAHFKAAQLSS